MPVLVRMPSPEPALACIPSVLLAASEFSIHRVDAQAAATQRIAINPKNNQCVCRLYEEEVRLCNARGGIDENSLVEDICKGIESGDELVARLYDDGVAAIGPPMHQSVPHVLVTGEGDAGLMFLELAVGIMRNNPVPTRRPRSLPRVDRAPLAGRLRGLLPRQGQGPRHLHERPRRARARPGSLGRQRRRDDLRDEDHDGFDLPGLRRQLHRRPEVRRPDDDPRGERPQAPARFPVALEPPRPPSSTKAAPFPLYATVARRATPPLQTLADGHSPPPPKSVTPRLGPTTPSSRRREARSQNLRRTPT